MCISCRCHFHFNCVTSTCLQADSHHRLVIWRCIFSNSRPNFELNHLGAEPRLNKQYHGSKQNQLVVLQCNANGILREVVALKTVLASLQVDVACIQETKLLPMDKAPEIPQHRAACLITIFRGRQGVEASSSMHM